MTVPVQRDRREAIEARLKRTAAPDPDVARTLAAKDDWYGWCRFCGFRCTGTPTQLTGRCPRCGGGVDEPKRT